MLDWMKHEAPAEIKIARRNINNLRHADETILMAESKEDLNSLLMKVKEESVKAGLRFNIQKTKIMASGPSTSWQIDWETMETMKDFIFLGSKITADADCSHEIKTLAPWKKSYDQSRWHIQKQRHYFTNKATVFLVVMYGCENWAVKKADSQRTDAFELWCWRRLLRVPWTARRPNQSILRRSALGFLWREWR